MYLGTDRFIRQAQKRVRVNQDLSEGTRAQHRPPAHSLARYASSSRDPAEAMGRAYAPGGYTLMEIASYFVVHYRTVSRAVKQAEERKGT